MTLRDAFTLGNALGCGLMAGFFYAFSICVMRALGKIPAAQGIAAMQSINVVVINPGFMIVFLGMAAASLFAIIAALTRWRGPGSGWLLAGGALYLVGTFGVTMLFNVPRNNALASLAADSPEAATRWTDYLRSWTLWNHVRALAALAATAAFALGLWARQ